MNPTPQPVLPEAVKTTWHLLTHELIEEMSKNGLKKNSLEANQYFSQWEEKCLNLFRAELTRLEAEKREAVEVERARVQTILKKYYDFYPRDVFPEESDSLDAESAKFARNLILQIEEDLIAPEQKQGGV